MHELSDDDALWIGQGVPLMDSRNAEIIALVRAGYRAAQAMTEGPAADPIADLCARLRDEASQYTDHTDLWAEAADALERLAATERLLQACTRHETARAERAEAERDALRECVRAADNLRRGEDCPMCDSGKLRNPAKLHWDTCAFANYDAARAKVNTTEGEK